MLIRQKPQNEDMFITVNSEMNTILQNNGFSPSFYHAGEFYYIKNNELLKILQKGG